MNEIIQNLSFSERLSIMSSRSLHVVSDGKILFFFMTWVVVHCIWLSHSFIKEHLCCFHMLAIICTPIIRLLFCLDWSHVLLIFFHSYSSTPPRKLATVVPTKSEPNVLQLPSHKSHHITSLPCGPNLAGFPRVFSTLCSLRCSVPFPHPYHHTLLVSFRPCLLCFGGPFSLPAFWRSSIPTALDLLQWPWPLSVFIATVCS